MGENKRKKEQRVEKSGRKKQGTKSKRHKKTEIGVGGRKGDKRVIIVKNKIENRKDKTKINEKKNRKTGLERQKIHIRGRKNRKNREPKEKKNKEVVEKTESKKK